MQETQVQPLGQEDPLEKEMATHSSVLAWEIPWQATVHEVTKSWTQLSNSTTTAAMNEWLIYFKKHESQVIEEGPRTTLQVGQTLSSSCL